MMTYPASFKNPETLVLPRLVVYSISLASRNSNRRSGLSSRSDRSVRMILDGIGRPARHLLYTWVAKCAMVAGLFRQQARVCITTRDQSI
jgi:hypothetical protein